MLFPLFAVVCCLNSLIAAESYLALQSSVAGRLQISHRRQQYLDYPLKSLTSIRGGSTPTVLLSSALSSPEVLYNSLFTGLAGISVVWKLYDVIQARSKGSDDTKPSNVKSLQARFLVVFWLLRMADWLQGPYFYEVYSSKVINGLPVSLDLVSKLFLIGFATTGIVGPALGRLVDARGRRFGTVLFGLLYSLSALSTQTNSLWLLALGRIAAGLGTSLLFSAPEAWLVGEHQREGNDGKWLGQTFGWAYSGDALVAITAGQLASMSAASSGPSGPFMTSIAFLAVGSLLAAITWKENVATSSTDKIEANKDSGGSIGEAMSVMLKDHRILLVGAVQALFESAMYIFVLQWPPIIKAAVQAMPWAIPYGKIFSCFMACCLLGSSSFNALQALSGGIRAETSTLGLLGLAAVSMSVATLLTGAGGGFAVLGLTGGALQSLIGITAAFFVFEACVGMYFPSIGLLRSRYIPDSHRSIIMNLFGLPLNLLVVSVFLSIQVLGTQGALAVASASLVLATLLMAVLRTCAPLTAIPVPVENV